MPRELICHRPIKPQPGFAQIVRRDEPFTNPGGAGVGHRVNSWFDRLMRQSGLEMSPDALLLLCLLFGLTLGGSAFVWRENLLITAATGMIGCLLPVSAALFARQRRQREVSKQLPGMIGELARIARTGRSLEQCLEVIAKDTPGPLGSELERCVRRLKLGLGLAEAFDDLPDRIGAPGINVLTLALTVHHAGGGNLVPVLERLEQSLHERIAFQGRLRAATAPSRAAAVLLLLMPVGILGFFLARDPNYFHHLLKSDWGRWTTAGAVLLQVIGTVWILRILKSSQA